MNIDEIILGSTSPYRKELLQNTHIKFRCASPVIDEKTIIDPRPPVLAYLRARAKGLSLSQKYPGALIIAADQVCEIQGQPIDKCHSQKEAIETLDRLKGQSHYLHNGLTLSLFLPAENRTYFKDLSGMVSLTMFELSPEEIAAYVNTQEWRGSVGAYKFEGQGKMLFRKIEGDETGIIGLPIRSLMKFFRSIGINALTNKSGPWDITLEHFNALT